MSESRRDLLRRLLAAVPPTRLAPCELFVAWHGVPTLAYRGGARRCSACGALPL